MRNCSTPASSATGAMPATGARQCRAIVAAIHGMKSKLASIMPPLRRWRSLLPPTVKLAAANREARYHRHHRSSRPPAQLGASPVKLAAVTLFTRLTAARLSLGRC
ncbi:hypothetical protein PVAP13_5NG405200 [Panicum virgatum]|uniref:Uncharacterized protein n=1 Tax=Panicum virgatum TaxID=38727 RepID=A0A8T0RY44_PANVG|nr:hypothetical protein PVAP13_5NG405200 [Panicum virgatum]